MKNKSTMKTRGLNTNRLFMNLFAILTVALILSGCKENIDEEDKDQAHILEVPEGFTVEKMADGLTFPTSVTWDEMGNMFVVEAGGAFLPEQMGPMRIMQVMEDGIKEEVVDLSEEGIKLAIVGLVWHDGWFYFTHRAEDATGPYPE